MTRWLVIGISGVTCSGKTTIAKKLHEFFENSIYINQDSYFLPSSDSRHKYIPELNHYNWDIITSLDMEKMHTDVLKLLRDSSNMNNEFCENKYDSETRIIIIDGFLIFDYKPIIDLCDFKYFLTLTRQKCWERRQIRLYDPPDVLGYFDKIVWPEYVKYKGRIEKNHELCENIIFINEEFNIDDIFQNICENIIKKKQSLTTTNLPE